MDRQDDLVDSLSQLAFATTAALTRLANEHDLSLPQLRVLGVLRGRRARMSELAEHLSLEKSSLSGLIERAETRGLVSRERSVTDGRAIEVFLTEHGEELSGLATARARALVLPLVGALTGPEQQQLNDLLTKAAFD